MLNRNTIYLLVGESGSGKTTIQNKLVENGYKALQSYTTRPPRYDGEVGHTFVTKAEFDNLEDICAFTAFGGHRYCATCKQVDEADTYIIDPAGIKYFKEHYKGDKNVVVIYVTAPIWVRFKRMIQRKGGSVKEAINRLKIDKAEFSGVAENCDFVLHNKHSLDKTVAVLLKTIRIFEVLNSGDVK